MRNPNVTDFGLNIAALIMLGRLLRTGRIDGDGMELLSGDDDEARDHHQVS